MKQVDTSALSANQQAAASVEWPFDANIEIIVNKPDYYAVSYDGGKIKGQSAVHVLEDDFDNQEVLEIVDKDDMDTHLEDAGSYLNNTHIWFLTKMRRMTSRANIMLVSLETMSTALSVGVLSTQCHGKRDHPARMV